MRNLKAPYVRKQERKERRQEELQRLGFGSKKRWTERWENDCDSKWRLAFASK